MAVLTAVGAYGLVLANENVDPNGDGSQYAYSENLGWINAEPSGDGGPGMEVRDFRVIGYLWSENAGWINLSCRNRASCAPVPYGVANDGSGHLSGFAWGENIGWIDFGPEESGVLVDPVSGIVSGRAWSENAGWITFSSQGANPYRTQVAWSCDPSPSPPASVANLVLSQASGITTLAWDPVNGATGYDVIEGDVSALLSSQGDFGEATRDCVSRKTEEVTATSTSTLQPDDSMWYLVRAANCGGQGTYDSSAAGQIEGRDDGIQSSLEDCQ